MRKLLGCELGAALRKGSTRAPRTRQTLSPSAIVTVSPSLLVLTVYVLRELPPPPPNLSPKNDAPPCASKFWFDQSLLSTTFENFKTIVVPRATIRETPI